MAKEFMAGNIMGLQARILALYDDMTEFQDQCSFLCDAFVSIVMERDVIDQETVRGVSIYSQWMKEQVGQIRSELKLTSEEVVMLAKANNVKGEH